jgi:hypothetical protein
MTLPHDRQIAAWLAEGPDQGPSEPLTRALAATHRTPKRPRWAFPERWLPMDIVMARTPSSRPFLLLATVALLIALLATAALLAGSQQRLPEPFGLARNGVVAYLADGDLVVADGLGMAPRELVAGPIVEGSVAFARQGDRLAYVRQGPLLST